MAQWQINVQKIKAHYFFFCGFMSTQTSWRRENDTQASTKCTHFTHTENRVDVNSLCKPPDKSLGFSNNEPHASYFQRI